LIPIVPANANCLLNSVFIIGISGYCVEKPAETFGSAATMRLSSQIFRAVVVLLALAGLPRHAVAQIAPQSAVPPQPNSAPQTLAPATSPATTNSAAARDPASVAHEIPPAPAKPGLLFDFKDSDIKFNLGALMSVLRDTRHEGWVLAAYPDPKTSRPLIGAGFGLDVTATPHPQSDLLNPHPFLEPSSAQLWQAAGLDSERLESILDQFNRDLDTWQKKKFRKKIRTHGLTEQLSEEEATQLLRISAIQAIYNARAYCRWFDQLTASQQMALSQLVFQMGVNLEEFVQFLGAINDASAYGEGAQPELNFEHWETVQSTLIESDWARRYSIRAIAVIAMFDPTYDQDPLAAQHKVQVQVHPIVTHHRKKAHAKATKTHKS
jgi:hypothetical protein